MSQNSIPLKTITLIITLVLLLLAATIFSILKYDTYAYQTTTINAEDNWVKVYSDSIDHGKSWSKKIVTPESKGFDCEIKEGSLHPYCIMLNWITFNEFQGLDLSQYKYMRIHLTYNPPNENDFLRVSLRHFDPSYTQFNIINTYKYNLIEIQKRNFTNIINIDLDQLIVPHWWLSMMKGEKINSTTEITNIPLIEISTGTHASIGSHKLRVSKIEFDKEIISLAKVYEYILLTWGLFTFLTLTLLSAYFAITLRIKSRNESNLIQINQALAKRSTELEYVNKTDELTGVLNRAGMQANMIRCIKNEISPVTIVMIDIDHFKKINDTYGHQTGDIVLQEFGKTLSDFIKSKESVSRFGGEEFMILIPNKSTNDVYDRIESLRQLIESKDMQIDHNVTASFGIASTTGKIDFKSLIEKADNALYVAKNSGRNCIKREGE